MYYFLSFAIVCLYVLVCALDGVPFEEQQEQGFEEVEQQQCFDEGKWILDHIFGPNNKLNTHLLLCVLVSRI